MHIRHLLNLTGKHRRSIYAILAYLLCTTIVILFIQNLHYPLLVKTLTWPFTYTVPFFANAAIIVTVALTFHTILNSAFYGFAVSLFLFIVVGIGNHEKVKALNTPFLPSDLLFVNQLSALSGYIIIPLLIIAVIIAISVFIGWKIRKKVPHLPLPGFVRITIFACIALSAVLIVRNHRAVITFINNTGEITNVTWDQKENYRRNGILYGFVLNVDTMMIEMPGGYSKERIDSILGKFKPVRRKGTTVRPNVILYMSESFWDITKAKKFHIPFDPVPNYHRLAKEGYGFDFITSTFGGGTCDPEFETLTGIPIKYFPWGSKAYQQYIMHTIPSITRVFAENGYRTSALHTFFRWFWNRNEVYRHMGFGSFTGLEEIKEREIKGEYVSDHYLAKMIMDEAKKDDDPYFIFAISMQNHGSYYRDRYSSFDREISNNSLSDNSEFMINNYVQGLVDADRSLQEIVEFVKKQKEPTVVIFFGDHLPGLDSAFDEINYFDTSKSQAFADRRRYTGTGVIFANYPIRKPNGRMINTTFMPLFIADAANVSTPAFYSYLRSIQKKYPAFTRNVTIDSKGRDIQLDDPVLSDTDDSYWNITYDILFGKQYSDKYMHIR